MTDFVHDGPRDTGNDRPFSGHADHRNGINAAGKMGTRSAYGCADPPIRVVISTQRPARPEPISLAYQKACLETQPAGILVEGFTTVHQGIRGKVPVRISDGNWSSLGSGLVFQHFSFRLNHDPAD